MLTIPSWWASRFEKCIGMATNTKMTFVSLGLFMASRPPPPLRPPSRKARVWGHPVRCRPGRSWRRTTPEGRSSRCYP